MAAHYFPEVEHGRVSLPVVVALAMLAGGMVAAFVIGTPAGTTRGEPAARAFLDTWQRSRLATFVVRSDFVRTLPDGNQLKSNTTTVQRPPDDRLVTGFGSVTGRLNGKIIGCAASPGWQRRLRHGRAGPRLPHRGRRRGPSARVIRHGADRPLYDVVDFGDAPNHCFRLDLAVALPSPPYGDHALFCFDRPTAAPVLTEIQRPEATDQTIATGDPNRCPPGRPADTRRSGSGGRVPRPGHPGWLRTSFTRPENCHRPLARGRCQLELVGGGTEATKGASTLEVLVAMRFGGSCNPRPGTPVCT